MSSESIAALNQRYLPLNLDGLTTEMVKRAERELGETEDTREEGLKELKRLINGEKDFRPIMDNRFLLRFLRARKMNPEKAFAALCNFYTFKVRYSGILTGFKPSDMKRVMDMNCLHILPYRDQDGCTIAVLRIETFDTEAAKIEEIISTSMLGGEYSLEKDATQVCGAVIICDLKGLTLKLVKQAASPSFWLRSIRAIQDCVPIRIKAFHLINEPFYFNILFNIIRRFLSEKMRNRFQFHGHKLKYFHEQVPPEILPNELGGTLGPMDNSSLKLKILEMESHFIKMNKYGYQEKRAQFIKRKSSTAFGLFL